jgi:hypothetical protein
MRSAATAPRVLLLEDLASLTAISYALTYVGFAVPIVLAELEPLASASLLLLLTGSLAAMSAGQLVRASARHPMRTRTLAGLPRARETEAGDRGGNPRAAVRAQGRL